MLIHNKDENVKFRRERDGTEVDLWLAKSDGRLNVHVVNHRQGKLPTLVRLDGFYMVAEAIIELGFSEEIMPYAYAIGTYKQNEYMKPFETNVQAIVNHHLWPIAIADKMTAAAQNMVGHFTGRTVTVEQMGGLSVTDAGEVDLTLKMGDPWTEAFELSDDCVFCSKMTDESVVDRVAGFQWSMDKEVASRFGAGLAKHGNPPKHYEHGDDDAGRREYHDELKPWYADHPMLLKVIPLIDLPLRLKRTLCIQWNHIVLEYIRVEPRFTYRSVDGTYFWMTVDGGRDDVTKRLIPHITTRSNPNGATEEVVFAGGGGYYGPF